MRDSLLMGVGRRMFPVPRLVWHRQVSQGAKRLKESLGFMSEEHHRVRYHVVRELPRAGAPIPPERISQQLNLPLTRVNVILEELERHLTFLFRNPQGAVAWAYPVTADRTPHQVSFGTSEQIYAAWAEDAIATPFVQGRLVSESLTFSIETECAHCAQPIHLELDGRLRCRVNDPGAEPLLFTPQVDFSKLKSPSIIDDFWTKSVFFWSEEHAREERARTGGTRGTYFTLAQAIYMTPHVQGALFAFPPNPRSRP